MIDRAIRSIVAHTAVQLGLPLYLKRKRATIIKQYLKLTQ